ncbi:uncharacterized protein [Triticum aestivum]|nr:uncharacterized protein LOC123051122 isoform X3 [Triticum aestivum]XP_044329848.1 uncharacterized protein LOC123051122 isoform X3 [Triticum aestivum]
MDTDSLNFAIRKMAREKSSDGDLKNSEPSCCKHYFSTDFARGAIECKLDDDSNIQLDSFFDKDFVGVCDALKGSNIEVLCVPVIYGDHWTMYAFNMNDRKLSILDSLPCSLDSGSKEIYYRHECIPLKIYKALVRANDKFKMFYNMSDFKVWKVDYPPRVPQQENGSNDCGFFVFKFMRHWNGNELVGSISSETMELRKEFLAYILSFDIDEAHGLPDSLDRLMKKLPSEASVAVIPSTTRAIDNAMPPLSVVAPGTKILVEPCKMLISPFLIKRQSFGRPDAKILEDLYQYTINNALPMWQWTGDILQLMKRGEMMDTICLNLAVSNMMRKDAHELLNTKCLGWRHYVDSDWAVKSLNGYSNPMVLKKTFYRGSVLYNASRSHMVFIPVAIPGDHWTLYAFNMCDQKLSILDSQPDTTKGVDPAERHQKIRCDVCDALTITMDFAIDFRSWEYGFPKLPRQQNSYDSGFFVFNFMRLWDGHRLARWFPTESRELRKDFLAYILSCKDNIVHLPEEVSSKIKDLPGKVMDSKLQEFVVAGATLTAENDLAISICPALVPSAESSNEYICYFNSHWNPSREAPATSRAADSPLTSSEFLSRCYRVTSDGDGVLHIAAWHGNVKLVVDIWKNHGALSRVLLSAVNNRGDTTLHYAAHRGHDDMVKLLFGIMSDMGIAKFQRAQNLKGDTCLHEAVRHGHAKVVEILISEDENVQGLESPSLVQIVDNDGISPLYLATTLRRIDIVRALTQRPYKYVASFAGPAGKTALHAAIVLLDKELIEILLEWNAGLASQGDESGSTPLHFLASLSLERREPIINLQLVCVILLVLSAVLFVRLPLSFAIPPLFVLIVSPRCYFQLFRKDPGIVELIMKKDPLAPLYTDSMGSLPLHVAAAHGRVIILHKLLIQCPHSVLSLNASGQNFIHVAVEKEKLGIVRYACQDISFPRLGLPRRLLPLLRRKKFDTQILNAQDQDGNTALHLAVNNASEDIFYSLMANMRVLLNLANKEGYTPLDLAFLSRHLEVSSKGSKEWIFFLLLHGGGDFGIFNWDHLTRNVVKPDWEKESKKVGKSASMLTVCAVLILNAALLAPFNVLSHKDKLDLNGFLFQIFVTIDTATFVCSAAATFFCVRAGFAMSDGSTRLKNLVSGKFFLGIAALSVMCTVALALFLVIPRGTAYYAISAAGASILAYTYISTLASKAIRCAPAMLSRVGVSRLASIMLFQRSTIKPPWMVPSASTGLFWIMALFGIYFAITSYN